KHKHKHKNKNKNKNMNCETEVVGKPGFFNCTLGDDVFLERICTGSETTNACGWNGKWGECFEGECMCLPGYQHDTTFLLIQNCGLPDWWWMFQMIFVLVLIAMTYIVVPLVLGMCSVRFRNAFRSPNLVVLSVLTFGQIIPLGLFSTAFIFQYTDQYQSERVAVLLSIAVGLYFAVQIAGQLLFVKALGPVLKGLGGMMRGADKYMRKVRIIVYSGVVAGIVTLVLVLVSAWHLRNKSDITAKHEIVFWTGFVGVILYTVYMVVWSGFMFRFLRVIYKNIKHHVKDISKTVGSSEDTKYNNLKNEIASSISSISLISREENNKLTKRQQDNRKGLEKELKKEEKILEKRLNQPKKITYFVSKFRKLSKMVLGYTISQTLVLAIALVLWFLSWNKNITLFFVFYLVVILVTFTNVWLTLNFAASLKRSPTTREYTGEKAVKLLLKESKPLALMLEEMREEQTTSNSNSITDFDTRLVETPVVNNRKSYRRGSLQRDVGSKQLITPPLSSNTFSIPIEDESSTLRRKESILPAIVVPRRRRGTKTVEKLGQNSRILRAGRKENTSSEFSFGFMEPNGSEISSESTRLLDSQQRNDMLDQV
ncbi:MAG: hypothetical protein ACTSUE_07210, partial [Promethearchaeota archaeon]